MTPYFSIALFIIGITILLISLYYNAILKKLLIAISYLLKIQANSNESVEEKITEIQQQLHKVGIKGITYDITYLHKKLIHEEKIEGIKLAKQIFYPNITGYVAIYVEKNRGEYKIINKLILYVLALQIVQAIHSDIDKINESFHRIEKLQTYIIHDLRNVLQYFQAMQYNIENLHTPEDEKRFLKFLKESATPVNEKINNLLSMINVDIENDDTKEEIDLYEFLEKSKNFYNFSLQIEGRAIIKASVQHIHTILNNILNNIQDKSFYEDKLRCYIRLEENEKEVCIFVTDDGKPFESPMAVCQPFYTTKEEAVGIGMYQTLRLVEGLGGSLRCYNESNHACVKVVLPKV